MIRPFLPIATAVLLSAVSIVPSHAQTSFEFGMKDRVFQQEYVLPDEVSEERIDLIKVGAAAMALVNPTFNKIILDQEGIRKRLGRECGLNLVKRSLPETLTDEQKRIEQIPDKSPPTVKTTCPMQVFVFSLALVDQKVMRQQLDWLANDIRSRFADDWVSSNRAQDPNFLAQVKAYAALSSRVDRLKRKGLSPDASIVSFIDTGSFEQRVAAVADMGLRARIDAQLTALEQDAPAILARQQTEAAAKQKEDERRAYIAHLTRQADQQVSFAREALESTRREYDSALMRARLNPDPKSTEAYRASELAETMKRQEEMLRLAIAERAKLMAHLAKVAHEDATGTHQVQVQQPQMQQTEAQPNTPPDCHDGERCRILEKTIFCDTLDRLQSVLAKPAGPQRRKLLHDLMTQRQCLTLEAGTPLYPRLPILKVRPIGEVPVDVVAATLEAGRTGFVLSSALVGEQTASR